MTRFWITIRQTTVHVFIVRDFIHTKRIIHVSFDLRPYLRYYGLRFDSSFWDHYFSYLWHIGLKTSHTSRWKCIYYVPKYRIVMLHYFYCLFLHRTFFRTLGTFQKVELSILISMYWWSSPIHACMDITHSIETLLSWVQIHDFNSFHTKQVCVHDILFQSYATLLLPFVLIISLTSLLQVCNSILHFHFRTRTVLDIISKLAYCWFQRKQRNQFDYEYVLTTETELTV